MALLCRQCHADVTDDIQFAKPNTRFTCKCGCAELRYQPDDPTVPYELNVNDKNLLLRRFRIRA